MKFFSVTIDPPTATSNHTMRAALPFLFTLFTAACGANSEMAQPIYPSTLPPAPRNASAEAPVRATGRFTEADLRAQRERGPAGLDALMAAYRTATPAERRDLEDAVDQVAAQRDASAAGLYWYTNLDEAKRVADEAKKPILSLRLLGALTDEYSCANSRFFRAVLYPHPEVNARMRGYVLHWSTERPAPIATIDFRDGRRVVRTVTGNSVHYVLDANGRPIEAMPGLVGPTAFARWLDESAGLHASLAGAPEQRAAVLGAHHRSVVARSQRTVASETRAVGVPGTWPAPALASYGARAMAGPSGGKGKNSDPSAYAAMPVAPSKAAVERPMVQALVPEEPPPLVETVAWSSLAPLHLDAGLADPAIRAFLRRKNPLDWTDPSRPVPLDDAQFEAMLGRFTLSVAEDTAKNELALRAVTAQWLARGNLGFTQLNGLVYSTLFLTPESDPWLGLVPPRVFTGLANDGVVVAR